MQNRRCSSPTDREEAVTAHLTRALMVRSDVEASECAARAERAARGLTYRQVEACKSRALHRANQRDVTVNPWLQ